MTAKTLEEEADLRFHINRAELWIRERVLLGDQKETVFTLMVASRMLLKRDKEIEELRARVKELEGMVPRWVRPTEVLSPKHRGWKSTETRCTEDGTFYLMVPPIRLSETKE